ncbi:aldehyde dehydrogenase family protein [[Clostridium] fimetarium]|uniref:Succinate-semialdehyde dehydrogenase / glutarate-semialdehyde dehydrogenase n=1 Tax=[Clostridium] fimetarium TaxID=99656 RepID=A0A1I0R5P2_9FIRM|nr:aldehyde dehydrogenase family protein [[Clostridium] fimetarium]SEW35841.1 succinate-semialdehyde dehydrogenase / glutarate-semialdehyde dehydrogenase [[Clostridium] fimetarium]
MNMIINGKLVEASDGKVLEILNPATGKLIDTVPAATEEDIKNAVSAAKAAQKIWAKVPVYEKSTIMRKFIALVEENKESLARTLSDETGKPINEARGEIGNIAIAFEAFSEKAKHLYGEVIPAGLEAGQDKHILFTQREPIGVVACIIPFNFPCDLFDQKVAPALLSGNAAIVKPSTDNPLTLCKLSKLLVDAGVTDGAIQIVTGRGSKVGAWLCSNPDVHLITLTGSTEVGIETAKTAAGNLTHVALELGGNDAFIVCEDADVDLATTELIWGRMYNTGQVCCASKRFLVHSSRVEEFAAKAVEKISAIKRGMPSEETAQMGCLISEKAAIDVEKQVNLTVDQGGRIILGGKRSGAFYDPTVIIDVPKTADVAIDMEIFGPVVPIIAFDTVEEAIEIANASIFGLCGCVFSENMKTAFKVANALECGGSVINGASFFRSFEMPFGGYKFSGIGTEGVLSTFNEMTTTKTIVLKNIL